MPGKNILIADDDQGILDILKEMIQREGYKVFLTSNGKEAVEAIKINPIDLAILDIKMPVMDGIEALKEIKKIDQGIEVLIMTGYADLETLRQAITDHGAFDYILKPFKRDEILNGIQNALLKRDFASQKKLREKELEERILQLEKEFHERTHQLRESQIKYRDIVENSNDAIVVVQDGKLKFANTKTVELTGYPQEELKDMSFLKMVHPEDRDMVAESYKSEDFSSIFSFRALRKSGESLFVEINTVRTTWEKRQATLNVIRDITERKQVEEELRLFSQAAESSPDGVAMGNLEGRITYVNETFVRMFGYSKEELMGKEIAFIYSKDQIPKLEEALKATIEGGWTGELVGKRKNGELFPMAISSTVVMDEKGRVIAHMASHRDITERKRAEETLKESEEKYRSLVESTEDSIYLVDRDCRYLFMNKKYLSRFGLTLDKVVGTSYGEFHSEKETKEFAGKVKKVFKTGNSLSYEYKSERDGGYYIRTLSPVKGPDGEIAALTVDSKDITERKLAEEKEKEHHKNIQLLSNTAMKFVEFPADKNIYNFIGEQLRELIGKDSYIVINAIDEEKSILTTRTVLGLGKLSDKVAGLLGKHPVGMTFNAKDEELVYHLSDGKLHLNEEGLYGMLLKTVPKTVCNSIEKLLNIKKIYGIGFTKDNELFGTVAIFLKENAGELKNKQIIEVFIKQASIAVQKRQAEEALRESEEFSSSLLDNSLNPILVINPDTSARYVNHAFEELTGFSSAEVIGGKAPYPWWTEETLKKTSRDLKEAMRKGARQLEKLFQKKNGERFSVEITSTPVKSKGEFLYYLANWVDITERKRAEEELRKSKEFAEGLISSMQDGLSVLNSKTEHINVNDSFCNMTGFSRDELIGVGVPHPYWPPEEYENIQKTFEKTLQGNFEDFELRFMRKNGEHFPVIVSPSWLKDRKGEVISYYATIKDITERKRAEEALRESETQKRAILDGSIDRIRLVDKDMKIIWANKTTTRELNIAPGDLIGQFCYKAFVGRDRPCDKCPTKKTIKTGKIEHAILKQPFSKGIEGETYWDDYAVPIKNESGDIVNLIQISRDITEKVQAEERLRESEATLQAILDASPIGISLVKNRVLGWANKAMYRIVGYEEGALLGKSARVLYGSDEEYERAGQELYSGIKESGMGQVETQWVRKDGTSFDCFLLVQSLNKIDYPEGQIVSVTDITERKEVEKELKRSREELRSLADHLQSIREEERTTIAREIHDELAQAMTALKMDISWLGKKLPKDQKTLLEKTRAMTKLTDTTIKTVKRISTELRPGLLDDLGLVAAIEWQAEEFKNRTGITCRIDVDPEDIMVEEKRSTILFRIFQETLTNIARHAKAKRVKVSLKEKADELVLKVIDNGKGITEKQISDPESLGLIGIRERVHPWKGEVKISGRPGKGTTVEVRIPVEEISRKGVKDAK